MVDGSIPYGGHLFKCIKLIMNGAFTEEQMQDLENNPLSEYDTTDTLLTTVEGYNIMYLSSVMFMKVPDMARENETLRIALAAKEAELQAALALLGSTQP